jgi:hypothetical protein
MTLLQFTRSAQHTEKVGSVGALWPPTYDEHNNRIKGFYLRAVDDKRELDSMFSTVRRIENEYQIAGRTTVRAFVKRELLFDRLKEHIAPYQIEATVPVDNAMHGYVMVYFAKNAPERVQQPEVLSMELESVKRIQKIQPIGWEEAISRIARYGYTISVLNDRSIDITRMLELYQEAYERYTFEINIQTINEILNNGNIVIVGRDKYGEIVSSLIAEYCAIELEHGKILHLYELSDYATFRAHRGNGLMTAMQIEALKIIRRLRGAEAIIYAEDRAAWEAVNISSKKAGLNYCGTLLQHCVIVSDRSFGEQGIYENLNVWAYID